VSLKAEAMTLVEVLVAMVLVSLVAGAALKVTADTGRLRVRDASALAADSLDTALRALLEMDLANADAVADDEGRLRIEGWAYLEPETLRLRHLPTTVTYAVESVAGRPRLVRTQESPGRKSQRRWVCSDAASIELAADSSEDLEDQPSDRRRVRIVFTGEHSGLAMEIDVPRE
jgi:type II secretory pathway pseudopilin PulG